MFAFKKEQSRRPYRLLITTSSLFLLLLGRSALALSPPRGRSRVFASVNGNDATPKEAPAAPCDIRVIGVGGGGGNAINRMIQTDSNSVEGVTFWAINTDAQALSRSLAPNVLNIGRKRTRGLGAGGDPVIGAKAALDDIYELKHICRGADLVFITAGMGGGTGSGAAPILGKIAKESYGCLTVAVVTKPFAFEGQRRMRQADESIEQLRKYVDTVILISNDKLLEILPDKTPLTDAFLAADNILRQGVQGISEIILKTGLVNVDFADVRAVMKDAGTALVGIGIGKGKKRASDAAKMALSSPLLEIPIHKAKRIVFHISGGNNLGLREVNEASELIYENADADANIIFGALVDPDMGDEVSIVVLACDFDTTDATQHRAEQSAEMQDDTDRHLSDEARRTDTESVLRSPSLVDGVRQPHQVATARRGFKRVVEPSKADEGRLRQLFRKIRGDR